MTSRPMCSYCAKPEIDHLGPKQYCNNRGETTFTTEKLIKRRVAAEVIAGMLATNKWIGSGCVGVLDLKDEAMAPLVAEAERMLESAGA